MYISYSWHAVERPKLEPDGWFAPVPKEASKVTENDLKRWAGEYLFFGGTARLEPPMGPWKDLQQVKDAYIAKLKAFYEENPTFTCHINQVWHRYGMEAGALFPWVQLNYSNSEVITASMRGASRAYGAPGFGVTGCDDCAVAYTEDPRYIRMSALHNWVAYISGGMMFMPELSQRWVRNGRLLPFHRYFADYFEYEVDRRRMEVEKDFYDYIRTHYRGNGPLTGLGFVQGNLDPWHGWNDSWDGKDGFHEGYYCPGEHLWYRPLEDVEGAAKWRYGPPEAGWRYLDVVFSHLRFIMAYPLIHPTGRQFYFCGTPYGKADIVPAEAPLESLKRYKALVFLGWNTATEEQYEKLKDYVKSGGTLFMALPQLSSSVRREADYEPIRGGDLRDLFGLIVFGKGERVGRIRFVEDSGADTIMFPVGKTYDLVGHERNQVHLASLRSFSARPLAVADGSGAPVLMENRLGKGYAYFLSLWNYPGEEKLSDFMRDIVRSIARGVQGSVRIRGNDNINFGVYLDAEGPVREGEVVTRIFLVDVDWWSVDKMRSYCELLLNGRAFPLTLPRADIKKVVFFKDIAVTSEDKMVHVETIARTRSGYRIVVQGGGTCGFDMFLLTGHVGRVRVDGRTVKFREDRANGVVSFEAKLSGRSTITVDLMKSDAVA
ncbi:MAG: hypothetical protein DRP95_02025 [Candidatus Latescibacterota bacterium]|nr:MAG: hypothetical protein DRP95_02025 [Candidatus Latescibacterota bacterium]